VSEIDVYSLRFINGLSSFKVGWSYVLLLQWEEAASAFVALKKESRWSKSFYCYLSSGGKKGAKLIAGTLAWEEEEGERASERGRPRLIAPPIVPPGKIAPPPHSSTGRKEKSQQPASMSRVSSRVFARHPSFLPPARSPRLV